MKSFVLFLAAVLIFLSAKSHASEEIRLSSGGTTATYVLNPIKGPFEKATGIKLSIATVGGKFAILDVDKGKAEAGGAAHTLEELAEIVKKDGIELKNLASIQVHKLSEPVKYAIIVHKDNPVTKLSKEQLKGIYTGKITNWKDAGGKDMPVIVVVPILQPAGIRTLSGKALDKEPVMKDVLEVDTYADVKKNVAVGVEAIGMVMEADIDHTVRSPETPVITTGPINLFTVGKPSSKIQTLIDFIRKEGTKYILK